MYTTLPAPLSRHNWKLVTEDSGGLRGTASIWDSVKNTITINYLSWYDLKILFQTTFS